MFERLRNAIRFFLISWEYSLLNFVSYRTSSLMYTIYNTFLTISTFITISVVYYVSSGIAGWSYYQLMFLAATMNIGVSILWNILGAGNLSTQLLKGGVDPYLVKPFGIATIFLSAYGLPSQMAGVASGLVLLLFAASHITFTLAGAVEYVVLLGVGTFAMILFTLMLVVLAYVLIKGSFFVNKLLGFGQGLSKYPLNIYGLAGQLIFTILFPIGLAYYYPSRAFMGAYSPLVVAAIALLGIAIAAVSYKLFYVLMKQYTSAGG